MTALPSSKRHRDLPHHILYKQILPRLPFKYLNRLKCISKELHSLISNDVKFAADQSRSADTSSSGLVYMTDGILSFFPDQELIGVPDPSLNFLNPTSLFNNIRLVSSTNGLLLLYGEFSHKASLCVCNPATKEMVFVPENVSWHKYFIYKMGLAYDPCELPDRFTIVDPFLYNSRDGRMYQFNVFGSYTGKWTRSSQSVYAYSNLEASKAVFAKGVIYWYRGKYLLWYDNKKDLAGSIMLPTIDERVHIGVYAGDIMFYRAWLGGIEVWRLTRGSHWDRLHATGSDGMIDVYASETNVMLDAYNFCPGMWMHPNSRSKIFLSLHIISPVWFDGQFVYIVVQVKYQDDTARLIRWEIMTGRVEEKGQINVWESWYINKILIYANSMARVPQILNETS